MGQVFYRDWTPGSFQDPTYNERNAITSIESWTPYVPRELPLQPNPTFDNRLTPPDFYLANIQEYGYTVAREFEPNPIADEAYRFAPEQPIRRDTFAQLSQRVTPAYVAGAAPTRGVYTGINDLGYE